MHSIFRLLSNNKKNKQDSSFEFNKDSLGDFKLPPEVIGLICKKLDIQTLAKFARSNKSILVVAEDTIIDFPMPSREGTNKVETWKARFGEAKKTFLVGQQIIQKAKKYGALNDREGENKRLDETLAAFKQFGHDLTKLLIITILLGLVSEAGWGKDGVEVTDLFRFFIYSVPLATLRFGCSFFQTNWNVAHAQQVPKDLENLYDLARKNV